MSASLPPEPAYNVPKLWMQGTLPLLPLTSSYCHAEWSTRTDLLLLL
jgi:hypothetical protein